VLVAGAMAFRNQNTPVVQLALSIASITYGGLLGTYLLGGLWPRARERDVIAAIIISVLVMTPIVLGVPWRLLPGLAWPWYVPLGTAVTVSVGMLSSLIGQADGRTSGPRTLSA
jgi:Na+/proline symporter